jgi:hypothetical protein
METLVNHLLRRHRRCLRWLVGLSLFARAAYADPAAGSCSDKAGPLMLEVRIGPAIGLFAVDDQYALALDAGVAVDRALRTYLVVSPQVQLQRGLTVIQVPLGIEHDIPISTVRGLYVYPRIALGYADFRVPGARDLHAGVAVAELGVKYTLGKHWYIGFEPFSLAAFFDSTGVSLSYRVLVSVGMDLL